MQRWILRVGILTAALLSTPLSHAQDKKIDKGRDAVRGRPTMNDAIFSLSALDNAWKNWGVKEKPADYENAVRERYGLHAAPYENGKLPMGFHVAPGTFGKGLVNDCLLCHAGRVAGQTIIGVGNASVDLQGIFDELPGPAGFPLPPPIRMSNVRGTIEANATVIYLLNLRNPDLSLRVPPEVKFDEEVCQDVPAWWLMKRKKTMYHTGVGHSESVRTMMPFLLSPLNSGAHIKKQEPIFADIRAYILSLEAPKYPFPVDKKFAAQGEPLFLKNCSKCHGTYGPDASYPSKVVPLDTIGTDPRLANGAPKEFVDHYVKSWFGQEKGPDGKPFTAQTIVGYQAPPLDGVWATAPYFHNGSAPTIYHVLNSKARPKVFSRSYRSEKEDYDSENVGLKINVIDGKLNGKMTPHEQRFIYDTTKPGRANTGHTFGDAFTEDQRRAVIEYLKTL